jgi:hypothetical protein
MTHQVHIFHVDRDATPADRARPIGGFELTADTHDAARKAALARLTADGQTVRALSFLADGGLAAVVTQPPPAPSSPQVQRARGGR